MAATGGCGLLGMDRRWCGATFATSAGRFAGPLVTAVITVSAPTLRLADGPGQSAFVRRRLARQ